MPDYTQTSRIPQKSRQARIRRASQAFQVPGDGIEPITDLVPPGELVVKTSGIYDVTNPQQILIGNSSAAAVTFRRPELSSYVGSTIVVKKNVDSLFSVISSRNLVDEYPVDRTPFNNYFLKTQHDSMSLTASSLSDGVWHAVNKQSLVRPQPGAIVAVNSDYTITSPDQVILVNTGASNTTITLPSASEYALGIPITVKKIDSGVGVVNINTAPAGLVFDFYNDLSLNGTFQLTSQYDRMSCQTYSESPVSEPGNPRRWYIVDF